jgi:hypothetical protein
MSDFYPISPLVGIVNTSYAAQAGVLNEMWAVRVVRGKKILAEKTIPSLDIDHIVGVAYGHIRVEGLSRHAVAQMAGRLMQFARRYQASGVCPNFEVPDLAYDDGTPASAAESTESVESGAAIPARGEEVETSVDMRLGMVPPIPRAIQNDAWLSSVEAHAITIAEMSAYGAALSSEHLEAMFDRVADELIRRWTDPSDPAAAVQRFGAMIQSCAAESQLPKTGSERATVETVNCDLLRICREVDPDLKRVPAAYPCALHERIAAKLSEATGLKISVNTSSTGCIVSFELK